nr:snail [Dynamena pumila]
MPRSFLVKNKLRLDESLTYSYKDETVPPGFAETFHRDVHEIKREDVHHKSTKINDNLTCFQPCCVPSVFVPNVSKDYCESRFPFYTRPRLYSPDNQMITERSGNRLSPTNRHFASLATYEKPLRAVTGKTKFYSVATSQSAVDEHHRDNIIIVKPSNCTTEQVKKDTYTNDLPTSRLSPNNSDSSNSNNNNNNGCTKKKDKQTRHFSCKYCDKDYMTLGALKMHIRTHTLPCKCKICGKAFSRPWLLQGHIRTHTGERPFGCSYCGRAFADRSNLRAHIQTHVDVKKYECKQCLKTFSRSTLLKKHELVDCVAIPNIS